MLTCMLLHVHNIIYLLSLIVARLRSGGVACPDVVLLRKHVLVMSFIGQDQRPAPKVKELRLPPEQMREIYQQCIQVR